MALVAAAAVIMNGNANHCQIYFSF